MTDNRWNFPTCASSRFHFSYTRKVYSSSTKGRLSKNCWKKNENDKKTKRAFIKGRKNFLVMTCFLYCNLAFSSGLISLPRNQIIGWSTYIDQSPPLQQQFPLMRIYLCRAKPGASSTSKPHNGWWSGIVFKKLSSALKSWKLLSMNFRVNSNERVPPIWCKLCTSTLLNLFKLFKLLDIWGLAWDTMKGRRNSNDIN